MGILRCNLSFWALALHTAESHLRTQMTSVQLGGSEAMEPLAIGKGLATERGERGRWAPSRQGGLQKWEMSGPVVPSLSGHDSEGYDVGGPLP
jgi:hypothetical protein